MLLATVAVMSFAVTMNTYAQNTTQTAELADNQTTVTTANMTNSTGLASGIIDDDVDDDAYEEGEEEGPGEDEDEPGDIDENDKED